MSESADEIHVFLAVRGHQIAAIPMGDMGRINPFDEAFWPFGIRQVALGNAVLGSPMMVPHGHTR